MLIWTARVSVTRKLRGSGQLVTCNEINLKKNCLNGLLKSIEFITNSYERDLFCVTCVISKIITL